MEQPSSSSKVTVEYYDPSSVYQLLSPGLLPRLPLRNLHWESHAGPLRSISSLHIDFVPSTEEPSLSTETSSASTNDLSRVKSEDSATSGDDGFRTQTIGQVAAERPESSSGPGKRAKSRRHQIPGLRQTPYLKVLFLRCDDNETYKTHSRKQVREWIKEHTPVVPSSLKLSSQENHDAFEWMIVHVIVPNTAAATQPRTSGKGSEGSSASNSEKTTARWRGGGSTTILEKLRADFNGTSKSSVDRIAQIRIGVNDVPYDMLPRVVPAIPGSYSETQQENDNSWIDLIAKFKFLILSSFDMRVSQYEEDIREKDSQRSLPGWNFCTFFVLKEGLARGFESVGLVEDALVGYDELSVGLDAIIRDQRIRVRVGAGPQHGASFLPFTEELRQESERARAAILRDLGQSESEVGEETIDLQSTTISTDRDVDDIPLNVHKKRYRELILSNDISVFDFRCYLFARQLALLLRLANASSSQEELLAKLKEQRESSLQGVAARGPASQPSEDAESLTILGEICRRSMDFIASIARITREDIWASRLHTQQQEGGIQKDAVFSDPIMTQVVDNIVSSFTFSVAQQILAQTSSKSLPIPPSTLAPPSGSYALDAQEQKTAIPEPKTMMHPARTTSLALRSSSREPPSPGLFPGARRKSLQDQTGTISSFLKAGLEELAAHRAELYIISRSILEQMGKLREWGSGWAENASLVTDSEDELEDVDLNAESQELSDSTGERTTIPASSHGISNQLLKTALQEKDDFYRLYETLTDKALRHYTVANHIQSLHSSMADLAVLKYHLEDFAAAASYFYRIRPFYGDDGWTQVELSILIMYAKSLKELQRKEEYVRVALKILSKVAVAEKEKLARKSILKLGKSDSISSKEIVSTESYLPELLSLTKTLTHELLYPLENFFGSVQVDSTTRYHSTKDSFSLQVTLQYLLSSNLHIEKAKLRLVQSSGDSNREIWLETEDPTRMKKGSVSLMFHSNTIVPGSYVVNYISLHACNMVLQYEQASVGASVESRTFFRSPKLLIYQRVEHFDVQLYASKYLHLDRTRYLEIGLESGWNQVINGELQLRAATAGLRLQTGEANIVSGTLELLKTAEAGVVRFGALPSGSKVKLRIPFNLEHEVNDITMRLELSYTTDQGTFFFAKTPSLSIMLPLGVNVQDLFKQNALFSKFTISSATTSPLRLLDSRLEGSDIFSATSGTMTTPIVIFPRQPALMLYKITKISASTDIRRSTGRNADKSSLSLVLHYVCLEEEIDKTLERELSALLKDASLEAYTRLVIPVVINELRAHLSAYDLERIAVLSEVSTSHIAEVNWRAHLSGLGGIEGHHQDVVTLLADRLRTWQKQTPTVPLLSVSNSKEAISESRSIVIPVEIPSVSVVHTADLIIADASLAPNDTFVAALNQPISAILSLRATRKWDTSSQTEYSVSGQTGYTEFFYEVSGASDTWLIGGRRKGHFKVPTKLEPLEEKRKESFPIVLIPLREGFLPYPHVDIKPVPVAKLEKGETGDLEKETARSSKQPLLTTSETDYKNVGETIKVISDARRTTVSLDASGPQGGAWLLESEMRSVGDDRAVIS